MNPRQSVLIAMFLAVAVYLLANAQASSLQTKISGLKQVPEQVPVNPVSPIVPTPGFGGGSSGNDNGGAGGSF